MVMIETGARRREIDDVASELFHANGYAATSVRDIARALDIQAASMYAHVTSKEDVLWSIVDSRLSTSIVLPAPTSPVMMMKPSAWCSP